MLLRKPQLGSSSSPGGFGSRPALGKVRTRAAAGGGGGGSGGGGSSFPLEAYWSKMLEQFPSHSQPLVKAVSLVCKPSVLSVALCSVLLHFADCVRRHKRNDMNVE